MQVCVHLYVFRKLCAYASGTLLSLWKMGSTAKSTGFTPHPSVCVHGVDVFFIIGNARPQWVVMMLAILMHKFHSIQGVLQRMRHSGIV